MMRINMSKICVGGIVLVALFMCSLSVRADDTDEYALLFYGAGARAMGMGGAFSAVADDASAGYWNPAGLGILKRRELMGMYTEGSNYNNLFYAHPTEDYGTWGVSGYYYNYSSIYSSVPAGYDVVWDMALTASYGRSFLKSKISVGTSVKYLVKTLEEDAGGGTSLRSTAGIDTGLLFKITDKITLSGVVQNLSPGLFMTGAETALEPWINLPVNYRVGFAIKSFFESATFAVDANFPGNEDNFIAVGCEYGMSRVSAMRIGFNTRSGYGNTLYLGISIGGKRLCFDWVLIPSNSAKNRVQRFGLTWLFEGFKTEITEEVELNKKRKEIKRKRRARAEGTGAGKLDVAVIGFKTQPPVSQDEVDSIAGLFRGKLAAGESLNVVDRSGMDEMLAGQSSEKIDCVTSDCAVRLGETLNVQVVVMGRLGKLDDGYTLSVDVVDVKAGIVLYSDRGECSSGDGVEAMIDELTGRMIKDLSK